MAGLKRIARDTTRELRALKETHQALDQAYARMKADHDGLLRFLIGLARESQERAWRAGPLRIKRSTLLNDDGWAVVTEVGERSEYVVIKAIRQAPTSLTPPQEAFHAEA